MNKEEPTLTEKLEVLFRRCFHCMARGHHRHHPHREEGRMGPGQGRMMALIADKEPINQKDLLELVDIRPSSLSEILGKIENEGFIVRHKDEEDKRSVVICMTPSGRAIIEETMQARRDYVQKLFAPLEEAEHEQLYGLLEKLIASWEQEAGEDEGCCCRHHHEGHPHGGHHHHHGHHGRMPHPGRPGDFPPGLR